MAGLGHNKNGFGCQLLFSSGELNRFYRCLTFFQTKTSCMSTDCEFVVQDLITALNNGTKKKKAPDEKWLWKLFVKNYEGHIPQFILFYMNINSPIELSEQKNSWDIGIIKLLENGGLEGQYSMALGYRWVFWKITSLGSLCSFSFTAKTENEPFLSFHRPWQKISTNTISV